MNIILLTDRFRKKSKLLFRFCIDSRKNIIILIISFIFQEKLVRFVTLSLVGNPNLENPDDLKRQHIIELCEKVAAFDPEFILKVRPYSLATEGWEGDFASVMK